MRSRSARLALTVVGAAGVALWLVPGKAIGQPANDDCTSVTPVALAAGGTLLFTGDNTGATNDCAELAPFGEVWVAFTTTECVNLRLDFCETDPNFSPGWQVLFDSCPCANFVTTDGGDDAYCFWYSPSTENLSLYWLDVPAGTYWYPVSTPAGNEGPYTITVYADACAGPWNDRCEDVTPVALAPGETLVVDGDGTGAFRHCFALGGEAETYVAFTTSECTHIAIDACGTTPQWVRWYWGLQTACPCTTDYLGYTDIVSGGYCRDHFYAGFFWANLPPGEYWYAVDALAEDEHPYTCRVHAYSCTATGACCLWDGTCLSDQTLLGCIDEEGVWQGAETECQPNPCRPWYCYAYGQCDVYGGQHISRVQVGDIDKSSACDSYGDFTHLSTGVWPGGSYTVTVTNGAPEAGDQCGIWADWNQDGDFDDPDETVTVSGSPGTGPYTALITPPLGAALGDTHLRVVLASSTDTLGPCEYVYHGEVEDYTVSVAGIMYVDDDAGPGGDGFSWGTAYKYLQDALDAAAPDPNQAEIRVAGGTYVPSEQTDPEDARSATFQLINGVALYGGYAGLADPNQPDRRDSSACVSILSGDIGTPGSDSDNCYHVVSGSGTDATALLDGFTITGGNANGSSDPCYRGGGMYNGAGSPTVCSCTFTENSAVSEGGGMCNAGGSPTVTSCVFIGNSADAWGGGMGNLYSNPTVTNCMFSGNSAVYGGAMDNYSNSNATVTNSTFTGNSAVYGGAVNNDAGNLTVVNCVLWGDAPDEVTYQGGGPPLITYSCIQGGYGGTGNTDADPDFVGGGDYHLQPGSPCIDAASNSAVPAGTVTDLEGNPRFIDDPETDPDTGEGTPPIVDMGAYEYQPYPTGDLNCDGSINGLDIDPFVLVLTATPPDYPEYYAQFPDGDHTLADCNDDGSINGLDIDPFVALLVGG